VDTLIAVLLVVIAVILYGVLTAVKSGFNQVIRGLEALAQKGSGEDPA
jgi:hypothetical protein